MNAKLIINNLAITLGHRQLEEIVFSLHDEPAMRDVFHALAAASSSEIRDDIAGKQNLSVKTRRQLIADTSLEVMRTIINSDEAREHMTLSDLERYLATGDTEILKALADDLNDFTQFHEVCESDWLCEKLINQPDPAVRYSLADNYDTPVFFLKKLTADEDIDVARKALQKLRQIEEDLGPDDDDYDE